MLNNTDNLFTHLKELGLSLSEARVYVELLKEPTTHLQLSKKIGINRTKVYRVVELLEKRSLVSRQSDERGAFLVAADPSTLQIELHSKGEHIRAQRDTLADLLPKLEHIKQGETRDGTIRVYEGVEGFKQMLWHELRTKDELLALGNVTVEELTGDRNWSEKFRNRTAELGYRIREIINVPYENPQFTGLYDYMGLYTSRTVGRGELPIDTPIVIYNDTAAIYQLREQSRIGVEIVNQFYANLMRQVFENYWRIGVDDAA